MAMVFSDIPYRRERYDTLQYIKDTYLPFAFVDGVRFDYVHVALLSRDGARHP